jgi:hypothetical protein
MPNIPWDLLASKLGRYLQLSYLAAVLAGACIAGELIVRALHGSPAQRRRSMATAMSNVKTGHENVLVVILVIIVVILLAYAVGALTRYVTAAVFQFAASLFFGFLGIVNFWSWWFNSDLRGSLLGTADEDSGPKRILGLRHINERTYDVKRPLGAIAYIWQFLSPNLKAKELWDLLARTYGEQCVISALAAHPIQTPFQDSQIPGISEYCRLWLNKFAPDMAVTNSEAGRLIATTFFIPVLLLPSSLWLVSYSMYSRGWWYFMWLIVVLVFLYVLITSSVTSGRGGRTVTQLLVRFVTVQLIEQSRNEPKLAVPLQLSRPRQMRHLIL